MTHKHDHKLAGRQRRGGGMEERKWKRWMNIRCRKRCVEDSKQVGTVNASVKMVERDTQGSDAGVRRGVLPVCEGAGNPGPRGWWQGGPLSSSPPLALGSAVQTAPPAPWPTPAEPLRSHTAPYTLHGPEGREGGRYTHQQSQTRCTTDTRCLTTDTPLLQSTAGPSPRGMQVMLVWLRSEGDKSPSLI